MFVDWRRLLMIKVGAETDYSKMTDALEAAYQFSTRAPELIIKSAAYHVVKRTIELTPFVPISRIDAELGVAVTLQPKKRGSGFLRAARTRKYEGGRMGTIVKNVPLAVLIIQASTRRGSNYNNRTNHRWYRAASPFKGKTREAGRQAMRAAVHRMIASRHSSIKFLIAGWAAVKSQLSAMFKGGGPPGEGSPAPLKQFKHFGQATWSGSGAHSVLEISNLVGTEPGRRGDNSANYNAALHLYGAPALQQAVNEQADAMIRHYWAKQFAEDLEPKWNAAR